MYYFSRSGEYESEPTNNCSAPQHRLMYSTLYLKLFISVQIAKPLNIVSWSTEDLSSRNSRTILNIVKSGSFRGPSGYGSAWKIGIRIPEVKKLYLFTTRSTNSSSGTLQRLLYIFQFNVAANSTCFRANNVSGGEDEN